MRVALINPTPIDHYSPCTRTLASYLKQHGHDVRQIFLPSDNYNTRFQPGYIKQMKQSLVDDMVKLVEDYDVIGISFLTAMIKFSMSCRF